MSSSLTPSKGRFIMKEDKDFAIDWDGVPSTRDGSSVVRAFACGALAGAALGVLFAPARGRDTRGRIASVARQQYDQASRLADRSLRAVEEQKQRVDTMIDQSRTRVAALKTDVIDAIEGARTAFARAKAEAVDQ
jgi:gas vesicle protein